MSAKTFVAAGMLCVGLMLSGSVGATESEVLGSWKLDPELTEELQPKRKRSKAPSGGFGGGFIGAGPVLVPLPGGTQSGPNANAMTLKFPMVLECEDLTLTQDESTVTASCLDGSTRDFFIGKKHGRKTNLKKNLLTESYSSTSRTVKHNFKINKDGNLVITVKLKPNGGQEQAYVRAFKPVSEPLSVADDTKQKKQEE